MSTYVPQNILATCSVILEENDEGVDEYSLYWSSILINGEEVDDDTLDDIIHHETIMDIDGIIYVDAGFTLRRLLDIAIYAELARFNNTTIMRKYFRGFLLNVNGTYTAEWE